MTGTLYPGFLDAHVHLALIDPAPLAAGGIGRVLDLGGWTPPRELPEKPNGALPHTAFAGQFLTTPGGYPARQTWAPPGSVCEVASATDAAAAVDRQRAAGASVIKVTLNTVAGPVLPGEVLAAIARQAHAGGAPVVAHAEGAGQALRAFEVGVDALAHTPFSERLDDALITAMAGRMAWISTLDIHGWGQPNPYFDRAVDNLRRFHLAGGQVLYGTDLGNGPLPVGLNRREVDALLAAGLTGDDVIRSLTMEHLGRYRRVLRAPVRAPGGPEHLVTVLPAPRPADPAEFGAWLCTARAVGSRSPSALAAHGAARGARSTPRPLP